MGSRSLGFVVALGLVFPAVAASEPKWPPASEATIRPGVQVISESGQCTANFVFYDATAVYIGFAAHCATARSNESGPVGIIGPCGDPSLPLETAVEIDGASRPGRLVYSSWETMARVRETDPDACRFNDFAVVRVDPADVGRVNPTIPFWGGPTGLRAGAPASGEKVVSYGNSGLRGGIEQLKPREGYVRAEVGNGWSYFSYFVTTGIFGDSGSAVLDGAGSASGVLVTLGADGTNGSTDLTHALTYMRRHTPLTMRLADGTEPFTGPLLGQGTAQPPPPQPDPQPEPEKPAPAPAPPPAAESPPPPSGNSSKKPQSRKRKMRRCKRGTAKRRQAARGKARSCRKPKKQRSTTRRRT